MIRPVALATLSIALTATLSSAQVVSPAGVWREANMKWSRAPKGIRPNPSRTGQSGILSFAEDGWFLLVYTSIYQGMAQGKPYEDVSQGDSWTIYVGTWKQAGNVVSVTYRLAYRDIGPIKPDGTVDCPKELQTKTMTLSKGRLAFDDVKYQRAIQLEPSVKQTFAGFISNPPKLDCDVTPAPN